MQKDVTTTTQSEKLEAITIPCQGLGWDITDKSTDGTNWQGLYKAYLLFVEGGDLEGFFWPDGFDFSRWLLLSTCPRTPRMSSGLKGFPERQ